MNTSSIKKIILKIQNLDQQIAELERVQIELATSGYVSATISSSGGSKSYSRIDLPKITALLSTLKTERRQYQLLLGNGGNGGLSFQKILHIYG